GRGLSLGRLGNRDRGGRRARARDREPDAIRTRCRIPGVVRSLAHADVAPAASGPVRARRGAGRSCAGSLHPRRGPVGRSRSGGAVAGPVALGLIAGLATLTFAMRATGPLLPHLPAALTERTAVLVAAVLSFLRVPLILCVVAGAAIAALVRALAHV